MEDWLAALYQEEGEEEGGEMCIITIHSFQVIFDDSNKVTQHTFHSGLCIIGFFLV